MLGDVTDVARGSCAEISIKLYTDLGTQPLTATFYSCKYSPMPLAYASCDIDAFVEFLHVRHEHQAKSKDDNYLFSPAIFDPNRSTERNRGKENILYLRHIVLDFEDGELQPETLPKLFPDLQMVVTNTFSHTSDKPRFRAVFFTDETMTPEVYGLIYNSIADKLEEAGYSVERAGKKLKTSNASELSSLRLGLVKELSPPVSSIFHAKHKVQTTASLLNTWKDVIHLTHQRGSKIPQFLFSQHLSHLTHLVTKHRRLTAQQSN